MLTAVGLTLILVLGADLMFPEQSSLLGKTVAGWMRTVFPEAARQTDATHGLVPYCLPERQIPDPQITDPPTGVAGQGRPVILIHGLDEPGRVWLNLAPALCREGFQVWEFTYPNDQAIEVSARLLFEKIRSVKWGQAGSLDLVAHSMGGLVARQMLTDPGMGYTSAIERGKVPAVNRLIMVGTPNHGAFLARFRLIMEAREQVLNRIHHHGSWLQGFLDGSGEAGPQLLPGSAFLDHLNARPHPEGVSMTVIAGIISPWLPVGDGLVSTASARLEKIAFYEVPGNHLTMVRNLSAGSCRVPPAVPLILGLLTRGTR